MPLKILAMVVMGWGHSLTANVSVLYDVADFQQKVQYEALKLNLK